MAFVESFRAARWIRSLNLILQAVLFLTFFAGLNYVALHYAWRFDLTRMHKHSLSAETRSYLSQLKKPVTIIVTLVETNQDEKYAQAYEDLNQLLGEYKYATESNAGGKVKFTHLDVFQRPREAQQFGLEQNQILINSAGRNRIVRLEDLYQFKEGKPTAFRGEEAVTSAILDVAGTDLKKAYFLVGHGELEPADVSPDKGLSVFRDQLSIRNFALEALDLRIKHKVPEDASLLIIARPVTSYEPFEQELLRQYLSTRAGRMLLFLDSNPSRTEYGLADLLFDWAVLADRALIYDRGPDGQNDSGGLVLKSFLPTHPVSKPLFDQKLPVAFGSCRSVRINPSREKDESIVAKVVIGVNPETAWGERDFQQTPPRFDPNVDIAGKAVGAAVASERVGAKVDLNFSVPRGRLVVFGCADFITNNRITALGNLTLALASVNWLVDRDTQLNIAPRPIEKFQLVLSKQELVRLRYSLLFGLPAATALLGLLVYWTRRQ